MSLKNQDKRNIKSILILTGFISLGALVNAIIEHGFNFYPLLNELIIGLLFGLIISISEIFLFEKRLRRLNFTLLLFIRTAFYVLIATIVIVAVAASRIGYRANVNYYEALNHDNFKSFLSSSEFLELLVYCILLSFFMNFIRQINRLLGQNVLFNYMAGRYDPPIEEELIFMFLDLKSSTTIAEKIGLTKNHKFLNDFFHDMTDAILESKGKIYQYVGDEVVIVWKIKDGIKDLNCLNLFWNIKDDIEKKKDVYIERYGVYPEFKAGIHVGEVIAGEIGDLKKDIAYHGDTVNTAARIQAECNKYGVLLLVSRDILYQMNFIPEYEAKSIGSIKLRGKETELELFSVVKK